MKRKKQKLPFAYVPHGCTVLAVDPGETSGWAIWRNGHLIAWGTVDVFGPGPASVIARFLAMPGVHVAVIERPFLARGAGGTSVGAADKIWRVRCQEARIRRVVRVYPSTWRSRVLKPAWLAEVPYHHAHRDTIKTEEIRVSSGIASQATMDPDEAAAVLIGQWACYAGEVLAAITPKPKKVRAA